jgi:uncharacterized delta-60 repeat protein
MPSNSIVFVDSRVANYQSLIDSLNEPNEVFILDGDKNGLDQMAGYLKGRSGLDAIHVISHGSQGALYLGSTVLDSSNLSAYEAQLGSIGSSLAQTGDILLYGCNVAQGDVGLQFIISLAQATGADVAASDDLTGSQQLDWNWLLERTTGSIETPEISNIQFKGMLSINTAPIFVSDGKTIGLRGDGVFIIAVQPIGKIFLAGTVNTSSGNYINTDFSLSRYNLDGSLDFNFSDVGMLTTDIGSKFNWASQDQASGIALQSDGKILIAGASSGPITGFALSRFNQDGTLDISFSEDGKVVAGNGFYSFGMGKSIAIQPDGKILLVGTSGSYLPHYKFALSRFNIDGSLDTTFSEDGNLTTDIGVDVSFGSSVLLQPDGKILIAGTSGLYPDSDFALARYNADGSLDNSFSDDGMLTTDIYYNSSDNVNCAALQSNGKIIVAGFNSYQGFVLVRYNTDGSLDSDFGSNGLVTIAIGNSGSIIYSIALQADGKILVGGASTDTNYTNKDTYRTYFTLVRYNEDGSLDATFSDDGIIKTAIREFDSYYGKKASNDYILNIFMMSDGTILASGISHNNPYNSSFSSVLISYNADGTINNKFGTSLLNGISVYTENGSSVVLDHDVSIYDSELSVNGNYAGATMSIYRQGGSSDEDIFSAISGGRLGLLVEGTDVLWDGAIVGKVVQNSGGVLELAFNEVTQTVIDAVLQQIAYSNRSDNPTANVTIEWRFSDGNTGAQGEGGTLTTIGSTTVYITAVNDPMTGSVAINGAATQGQTLTVADTLADADGMGTVSYQWLANGQVINNASDNSYTLTQAEVGKVITVAASFINAQNMAESITSAATDIVTNVNDASAGSITISGTFKQGETLVASQTLSDADGLGAVNYQWMANGEIILNAIGASLKLGHAEVGKTISVKASYTDYFGTSESVISAAIQIVIARDNTAPFFSTGDGYVITHISDDVGYKLILQPDGKILVSGESTNGSARELVLVRYNADGSLDTQFSGDGITSYGPMSDHSIQGSGIALQTDGKVLVAGTYGGQFGVIRYNKDGNLDTTFGVNGTVNTAGSNSYDLALQPDGKILVAGNKGYGLNFDFSLARYNTDGSIDTSFSGDGSLETYFSSYSEARSLAIQSDGKIVLVGPSIGYYYDGAVARYNSDGSLDNTFSGDGKSILTFNNQGGELRDVLIQDDGRILVAGYGTVGSRNGLALARFNADGALDSSFSDDGWLITDIGGIYSIGRSIALQADGKIVAVGFTNNGANLDIALWRYNTDGTLDRSFSDDGVATTDIAGLNDQAFDLKIQDDGKILVTGFVQNSLDRDIVLVRYNADGSLDTTFDTGLLNGMLILLEGGPPVVLDTDVHVFDTELAESGNYAGARVTLKRQGGANSEDVFSCASDGTLAPLVSGEILTLSGISIGEVTHNSEGVLALVFNENATQALVDKTLQQIAYNNNSDNPASQVRIDWIFDDGNAGIQGGGGAFATTGQTTIKIVATNDLPTGTVTLSGTATQGQTLAAANTLGDIDGLGVISYQWKAGGVAITGATGSTLVLGQAQVGKAITVAASYTDAQGTAESVASTATGAVANVNDLPTGAVTLSGTATQGQTLTAANTLGDIDGIPAAGTTGAISYQWKAGSVAITGATGSTLVLGQAQVGKAITVTATYTDAQGTAESVTSTASTAVLNVNDLPTGTVTLSGTATQGQTLTAANTLGDIDGLGVISYQWKAGGVAIAGVTNSTLVLGQAQVSKPITVVASYTDAQGTAESVASTATGAVANINDLPTGTVTLSGTATQGQTLTAANTLGDIDGIPSAGTTGAISYQWKAGGVAITGATGNTLVLGQAQVGKAITVAASYTDAQGTKESVASTATTNVLNINDLPTGTVTLSGTATQGQTLAAANTLGDIDGLGVISYQWKAGGVDIAGATGNTLVLGQAQVSKPITVVASYTDAQGTAESVTSTASTAVLNVNDLPTGTVTFSGSATQGQTLTVANTLGDIDGIPSAGTTGAISYQWKAGGVAITGATGSTMVLGQAQVSKPITVVASYTDAQGTTESVASTATGAVENINDLPTGAVTIGGTATQGQTLTASNTIADIDGIPSTGPGVLIYRWQADSVDIVGASNSTLVLSQSQVGKAIQVIATYTDALGTSENLASTATSRVASATSSPGATSGNDVLTGTPGADTLDGGLGADTLIGGDGSDTYFVDAEGDVVRETNADLSTGGADRIYSAVTYTLGANVENLFLTGTGTLTGVGNDLANYLEGNTATNYLSGGLGADTMAGNDGSDTYYVNSIQDVVIETNANKATGGVDNVVSTVSYTLGANLENLQLSGTGTITGIGNDDANYIEGNAAANFLSGGLGADTLKGGDASDTYYVDDILDVVIETNAVQTTGGIDNVVSTVSYTLGANLENILLSGTGSITGIGNELANYIEGNAAANYLSGGLGADTLKGNDGSDTYYVDNINDVVLETNADQTTGGIDNVVSTVSYTLGVNLENILLSGSGNITGIGNMDANYIEGNASSNYLSGGLGADTLKGNDGDDTYYVDSIHDVVLETNADKATGGTDNVVSSVSYTLGANLENILLSGTDSITGIGNALANYIEGNSATNYLSGGLGADTMQGNDGNDTYYVDSIHDVVIESNADQSNGGTDNVVSSVSYTLGANLENLLLSGGDAITGIGNDGNNYLEGNDALNYLAGGFGKDTLKGNAGADTFVYFSTQESKVGAGNRDVIVDFSSAQGDKIELSSIDANTTLANDQAFSYIGNAAFSAAGQLRLVGGVLSGDTNGDAMADFEIALTGVSVLGVGDFVL